MTLREINWEIIMNILIIQKKINFTDELMTNAWVFFLGNFYLPMLSIAILGVYTIIWRRCLRPLKVKSGLSAVYNMCLCGLLEIQSNYILSD